MYDTRRCIGQLEEELISVSCVGGALLLLALGHIVVAARAGRARGPTAPVPAPVPALAVPGEDWVNERVQTLRREGWDVRVFSCGVGYVASRAP